MKIKKPIKLKKKTIITISIIVLFILVFTLTGTTSKTINFISNAIKSASNEPYAYISNISLTKTIDGTAPFDNLIADEETYDSDGNLLTYSYGDDSSDNNGIVRSFDTITYNVETYFQPLNAKDDYTTSNIYFESELNNDITEAKFDVDQMLWLASYTITYYDKDDNVLATATNAYPDYSANKYATGSDQGENSYTTPVVKQVITGIYNMAGETSTSIVIPGTKTFSIGIKVLSAKNGTEIEPTFKFWVENNEDNITDSTTIENTVYPNKTTVSAVSRYNMRLAKSGRLNYLSLFDLSSGNETSTASDTTVYGRMQGYGIMLQLYNIYNGNESGASNSTKGFKGVEYPVGDITFDVTFDETGIIISDGTNIEEVSTYSPILWDYKMNTASTTGNWQRNLKWNNNDTTKRMTFVAPLSGTYTLNSQSTSYHGGTVTTSADKITNPSTITGSSNTYSFTVSDYDFDLDTYTFPDRADGNSSAIAGWNTYIGIFSTVYLETLLQFPSDYSASTTLYLQATADNLNINSVSGQDAADYTTSSTTNNRNYKSEVTYSDNTLNNSISIYVAGSAFKRNSVTSTAGTSVSSGFLGTNYWTESYTATAVAGQSVRLISDTYLNISTDNKIKALNMLLKFDSEVYELTGVNGFIFDNTYKTDDTTYTYLYAADPLYPEGWSSNDSTEMARMNSAVEEDLIYFSSLDELEKAGYTCVAVLGELRNVNVRDDLAVVLYVGATIKDDESLIGKTYANTNSVRIWSTDGDMDGISWANGNNNLTSVDTALTSFKNSLDNYETPDYKLEATKYIKAEFEDGLLVTGTHNGGYPYGMSVLVIGYKSSVNITSEKDTYDMDKGERLAEYTITPSLTLSSGTQSSAKTDLKIKIELDDNLTFLVGSLTSNGSTISNDENNPTKLTDNDGYTYYAYYEISSDGNTYLHLKDVTVLTTTLPTITFQATIGHAGQSNDVKNNDKVSATVSISGTADNRAYNTTLGNTATKTISVIKLSSTSLGKFTEDTIIEKNNTITYNITYSNSSESALDNFILYDVLPNNNDNRGSSFDGTYTITDIKTTFNNDTTNSATIYYSNASTSQVFTSAEANEQISSFKEYTGGEINAKVIAIKGTGLTAQSNITITFTLNLKDNDSGNIYTNHTFVYNPDSVASTMLNSNYVQTVVVKRTISGISFVDTNDNNLYDSSEDTLYKGIKVYLLNSNQETIDTTTTDENGYYEFEVPSNGTYYVKFTLPDGYELITKGDTSLSSVVNDNLLTDVIDHTYTISSPIEKITDVNIGIKKKQYTLIVHHYIENTTTKLADDETSTIYYGDNYQTSVADVNSNYELVSTPSNASGTIYGYTEVTYYYKLKSANLIVHHYIENTTTKLADDETSTVHYGDNYQTSAADVDSNYELVSTPSNASGTISSDNTEVAYYYKLKTANLIVHHYIDGTTTKLASDETSTVKYGQKYETTSSSSVPQNYKLVKKTDNYTGIVSTPTIEVIYYYQEKDSDLDTTITKTGTEKITSPKEEVSYTIIYNAQIKEYIGDSTITITDTLPYEIDEELSSLEGGTYNPSDKTITWTYTWNNINSYEEENSVANKEISINIKLVYKDVVATERLMINKVNGKIELDNNTDEVEDTAETLINIPGTIITHYYEKGTTNKLASDDTTTDLVGESYITEPKEIEGYTLVTTPEVDLYYYQEEDQEIIYEYEKIKLTVTTRVIGKHGTIEGDEIVLYGDNSTENYIKIKADEGYVIGAIIINGEELEIEENQETMILSNFIQMSEDKLVEVKFISKPVNNPNTKDYLIMFIVGANILAILSIFIIYIRPRIIKQ